MEIDKILQRIKFKNDERIEPTLNNLKELMTSYILNVPYENLSLKLKLGFSSNLLNIYKKIVRQNRGGVCYESNTLFAYLIQKLGYKVKMIFAQVEDKENIASNYPHLALMVRINKEDYLVDVGMGVGPWEPISIDNETHKVLSENSTYSIKKDNEKFNLLENKNGEVEIKYSFTKESRRVADFSSIFTETEYENYAQKAPILVTQAIENGRLTIYNNILSIKKDSEKRSFDITNMDKREVLKKYFNIEIR